MDSPLKPLAFASLFLLLGCQQSSDVDPCYGYGCHFDSVTELGIRYRDDIGDETAISPAQVDNAYKSISECFGLWFEPDIWVVATNDAPDGFTGYYWQTDGYGSFITIRGSEYNSFIMNWMRHEFAHHFLYLSTGSVDPDHKSPMWDVCNTGGA